jgi:hypothetical protein
MIVAERLVADSGLSNQLAAVGVCTNMPPDSSADPL